LPRQSSMHDSKHVHKGTKKQDKRVTDKSALVVCPNIPPFQQCQS